MKENIEIKDIITAVCKKYNVTEQQLRERNRKPHLVTPRQVFCYVARELTGTSFCAIGRHIWRNDKTAKHAYNQIKNQLEVYKDLRKEVDEILNNSSFSLIPINVDLLKMSNKN